MDPITLLVAAAAVIWLYRRLTPSRPRRRHRPRWAGARNRRGAGASAAARAHQLRSGTWPQLASLVGITTTAHRAAARNEAGAAGERATAELLDRLTARGWTVLHDRALPYGRANLDHLLISPTGLIIVCDSKQWTASQTLAVHNDRLIHGHRDVTDRLRGLHHERGLVAATLHQPVTPIIAMHGPPMLGRDGGPAHELTVNGVRIVPATRLLDVLRQLDPTTHRTPTAHTLAERATQAFPPYTSR